MDEAPLPKDPADPRLGTVVCGKRYHVWRRVADGGMGRVYQAFDRKEQRSVALKVLHGHVAEDAVAVERFKREFECSASLPHEHIVDVLAFERTEDASYALVMEYLEGEELRAILAREKVLPPERVIRMMSHVAIGLRAAHERKVVHRDLKPDNIFLCGTSDGDLVKILDFGSVRDNSAQAKKLTMIGTTIGSPFYMSPEQAQALSTLDHRADVWSCAAIAYECLTGRVPFTGPTGPSILLSILTEEAALPSEVGAEGSVPATVDAVMEVGLAKDPEIRCASVGAFVDLLGRAYGLQGGHEAWASTPEGLLRDAIAAGMERLEGARAGAAGPSARAMDAAFRAENTPPNPFAEDMVMGVPSTRPRWVVPLVIALAVGVVLMLALLVSRSG